MSGSSDPRLTVGLIGLGNMGAPVAERILAAGFPLVVYNRTPEKARSFETRGAVVAETPQDVVRQSDIVLTSLADDSALEDVAAVVLGSARAGTILADMSTVSPAASARVAALADAASVSYLRAPVSGNPSVVRAGNLTFMVSGPPHAFERAEHVIRAIGPTIHYLGEEEEARVVKLAVNLMIAGLAQLMSEALVLGESAGVARATLLDVMGNSAAGAPFVKYKTEPLLRNDFSATFTTALMEKDVDLVLDVAADANVELPLAGAIKLLLRAAIDGGYADQDFMALFLQLRKAAGLDAAGRLSRMGV
ncbi:MAG: NAD(P)-dependent oxidoreductase [Thermoleophilia bacterium]|nr:NAD(P)-dependent oxidoreductase [Thermoleophilia bacterium]